MGLINQSATWSHQYCALFLIQVKHILSKVAQAMQDPVLNIIHHLLYLHERDTCAIAYKIHLTAQRRTCLLHTWSVQGRGIDSKSVSAADLHS